MPLNSRLVRVKTNASWVGKAGTRLALRRNGRGRVLLDLAWRTARMAQTRRMGKVARKVQRRGFRPAMGVVKLPDRIRC